MTGTGGVGLSHAEISTQLFRFAEFEAAGTSPLYEHLAWHAAEDTEVSGLLTAAEGRFATPTLLLAAAHRLVIAEPISELANYYPSVGGTYGVDAVTWPLFREFVLARAERMRELIVAHTTQTNEVRRAALIYPAVVLAAKQAKAPVGLLEVGASAGLLLGLDRYGYRYTFPGGEQVAAGQTKATLVLRTRLELAGGAKPPALPKKLSIAGKVGLDRAPVELTDDDQLAWLEACIWADQPERLRRLGLAAAAQRADRPTLVTGDAVDDLTAAVRRFPDGAPLVVLTSHSLAYLGEQRRAEFVDTLGKLARERPLWWVSQEAYEAGLHLVLPERDDLRRRDDGQYEATLGLVHFSHGEPVGRALARTSAHGEAMTWLDGVG